MAHPRDTLTDERLLALTSGLGAPQRRNIRLVLDWLFGQSDVHGILLGGSQSRGHSDDLSDCDLFCHVADPARLTSSLTNSLRDSDMVRIVVHQGYYPWFGILDTVMFHNHETFAIDVGFVSDESACEFFWEPSGTILLDDAGVIANSIRSNRARGNLNQFGPSEPFKNIMLLLWKIRKNLQRGHLWNTYEYVNQLRRYLTYMLRAIYIVNDSYLGRPDRDVDTLLPPSLNVRLQATVPRMTEESLARVALDIVSWSDELSERMRFDSCKEYAQEIAEVCDWLRYGVGR